jgi:hypothetical protein
MELSHGIRILKRRQNWILYMKHRSLLVTCYHGLNWWQDTACSILEQRITAIKRTCCLLWSEPARVRCPHQNCRAQLRTTADRSHFTSFEQRLRVGKVSSGSICASSSAWTTSLLLCAHFTRTTRILHIRRAHLTRLSQLEAPRPCPRIRQWSLRMHPVPAAVAAGRTVYGPRVEVSALQPYVRTRVRNGTCTYGLTRYGHGVATALLP